MSTLSKDARVILDRMVADRRYDEKDLRAFVPDAGSEVLREVMHELWINRQVERVGDSGWRRHRSAAGHEGPREARREPKVVKPEELFDYDAFEEFFK